MTAKVEARVIQIEDVFGVKTENPFEESVVRPESSGGRCVG